MIPAQARSLPFAALCRVRPFPAPAPSGRRASPLAVAEVTSIEVSRTGLATVVGTGTAYFILADHTPEACVAGSPLTYSNFKIWKVPPGGTFNLASRPTTGYYLRSVNNGVIDQNPY